MGLRAVAVGLVALHHWALVAFPLGEIGRLPLFVLSGYLISGILWKNQIYWGGTTSWQRRLGVFYSRRFLRIIPPYYAALALGALLPLVTLHQYPWWFILPLSNILCFRLEHWPEGVGHYWSMAVEEQFYMVWPLLLGIFRQRTTGLWLLVAGGIAYRAYAVVYLTPAAPTFATVLLPGCLDLFAMGALLRLHITAAPAGTGAPWPGWPAALAWVAWAGFWYSTRAFNFGEPIWIVIYPTMGAGAGYLTLRWLMGSPPLARWLAYPLAQWLGQRSYGLYLFHLMLPVFYQRLIFHLIPASQPHATAWRQLWLQPLPTVLVLTPLVIGLSAASWHFLEAPLEQLRVRLNYAPTSARPAVATE